jgi:hypothetical protein
MDPVLRAIRPDDLIGLNGPGDRMLALNNANAEALSFLESHELLYLVTETFHATRIGNVDAFLLSFDPLADYDSPNFRWFCERGEGFIYVDRVVVAPEARGRGLARHLYEDLFRMARHRGYDRVVCEVNSEPPNPASDAFHAALGFVEVGTAQISPTKTVRYLQRDL